MGRPVTRNEQMHGRAVKAAKAYYAQQHPDSVLIDEAFTSIVGAIDLVIEEDGVLHLIWVRVMEYDLCAPVVAAERRRHSMEQRAIAWLDAHRDHVGVMLSFDVVDICVIGDDRAIMRVQTSVLSRTDDQLREDDITLHGLLKTAEIPGEDAK